MLRTRGFRVHVLGFRQIMENETDKLNMKCTPGGRGGGGGWVYGRCCVGQVTTM